MAATMSRVIWSICSSMCTQHKKIGITLKDGMLNIMILNVFTKYH